MRFVFALFALLVLVVTADAHGRGQALAVECVGAPRFVQPARQYYAPPAIVVPQRSYYRQSFALPVNDCYAAPAQFGYAQQQSFGYAQSFRAQSFQSYQPQAFYAPQAQFGYAQGVGFAPQGFAIERREGLLERIVGNLGARRDARASLRATARFGAPPAAIIRR